MRLGKHTRAEAWRHIAHPRDNKYEWPWDCRCGFLERRKPGRRVAPCNIKSGVKIGRDVEMDRRGGVHVL